MNSYQSGSQVTCAFMLTFMTKKPEERRNEPSGCRGRPQGAAKNSCLWLSRWGPEECIPDDLGTVATQGALVHTCRQALQVTDERFHEVRRARRNESSKHHELA